MQPKESQLGQQSAYVQQYQPSLLFPISRQTKRNEIGITNTLPFYGHDIWNAYEISFLNMKGKPVVALATIIVPAESPYIFESKSLKLYLNSFNQTQFAHITAVENTITIDLSSIVKMPVTVHLESLDQSTAHNTIQSLPGTCIDHLDISIDNYFVQSPILKTEDDHIAETLCSHLLKSNCLVTNQPDWGSVSIEYTGQKIHQESLLKYLIGFRQHNEFHEQCVERIYMDIQKQCKPEMLSVYARYTRRGGIDINPYRSSEKNPPITNPRLVRQ